MDAYRAREGSALPRAGNRQNLAAFSGLSVSTRSMSRQTSLNLSVLADGLDTPTSSAQPSVRISTLTRPTLASARKASSSLKSSTSTRRIAKAPLRNSDYNPSVHSSTSAAKAGGVRVQSYPVKSTSVSIGHTAEDGDERRIMGGKRKVVDANERAKKVRLHSPISYRPRPRAGAESGTPSHRFKYPTTPHRDTQPASTPSRPGQSTAMFTKPSIHSNHGLGSRNVTTTARTGMKPPMTPKVSRSDTFWKTPLAHTPNRIHDTPPQDMSGISEDDLLMGDEPLPIVWAGDTPMKRIGGVKDEADRLPARKDVMVGGLKRTKPLVPALEDSSHDIAHDAPEGYSDRSDYEMDIGSSGVDLSGTTTPMESPKAPEIHTEDAELAGEVSGESAQDVTSTANTPPRSAPIDRDTLAVPASVFTIASSPRKGLGSISRFEGSRVTQVLEQVDGLAASNQQAAPSPAMLTEDLCLNSIPAAPVTSQPPMGHTKVPEVTMKAAELMPPPSRIPVKVNPIHPLSISTKPFPAPTSENAPKQTSLSSLPSRRPISKPNMVRSTGISLLSDGQPSTITATHRPPSTTSTTAPEDTVIRRKPSYPSSLGSGPLAKPRERMVSVPVPSHIIEPSYPDLDYYNTGSLPLAPRSPGLRSVSAPMPRDRDRERASLSLSTRREGYADTNRSLYGLSEALERLKVKKENTQRPSLASSTTIRSRLSMLEEAATISGKENEIQVTNENRLSMSTSSRLAAVHRSRFSLAGLSGVSGTQDAEATMDVDGDKSLAAIVCASGGTCMKGVTAFVDVWTADGTDSSAIFAGMLKSLGAKVLSRPTESCTHIIYKSGKPSTLSWYRKQEDPKPHIVGISWVTRSKKAAKRLDEGKYKVEVGEEDVFSKRRKSMEPKQLSLLNSLSCSAGPGAVLPSKSGLAEIKRKISLHARMLQLPFQTVYSLQRKQLSSYGTNDTHTTAKVGSPLKKGHHRHSVFDEY